VFAVVFSLLLCEACIGLHAEAIRRLFSCSFFLVQHVHFAKCMQRPICNFGLRPTLAFYIVSNNNQAKNCITKKPTWCIHSCFDDHDIMFVLIEIPDTFGRVHLNSQLRRSFSQT
jgi:hypothetical protein